MKVIDEQHLENYLCEGYLRLPGAIPAPLLQRLRDLFDDLMFRSGPDELLVKILIHDMMLAHSSDPLTQRAMRRFLYLI